MKKLFLLVLAAVAIAAPAAEAREAKLYTGVPWYSTTRLHLAVAADYTTFTRAGAEAAPQLPFKREWQIGPAGAWVLVDGFALSGKVAYGVDNRLVQWSVGVRADLYQGGN